MLIKTIEFYKSLGLVARGFLAAVFLAIIGLIAQSFWLQIHNPSICCSTNLLCEDSKSVVEPPKMDNQCWVAYSPTHSNPNQGLLATEDTIKADLDVLHKSGFSGLVTYSSKGLYGTKLVEYAEEIGFDSIIMGVYDPLDKDEIEQAAKSAYHNIVKGFVVGNEGLYPKEGKPRYELCRLKESINFLRNKTRKPIATSEDSKAYEQHVELLDVGDWLFPNAHPYWAGFSDPNQAVEWTKRFYYKFKSASGRKPVFIKEVGLPADAGNNKQTQDQAKYYEALWSKSQGNDGLKFVYFEAFDQPWKAIQGQVETSWGLFKDDRSPKPAAGTLCGRKTDNIASPAPPTSHPISVVRPDFFVFKDTNFAQNHFSPSGVMGDIGDIIIDTSAQGSYSGSTSTAVTYRIRGTKPYTCGYAPPCKWAGVYWQYPDGNFGNVPKAGFDLRGYTRLRFLARSPQSVRVKFFVGGIGGQFPDSITLPVERYITLTPAWTEYDIDLSGSDLSYVIGGFGLSIDWVSNHISSANGSRFSIFVDDIRFTH